MAFTITAKAIVPKALDSQKVQLLVQKALHEEGRRDQQLLSKTTSGWSSAPPIRYRVGFSRSAAWVWIGPTGPLIDKWIRIDEGTPSRGWTSANMMIFPFQGVGRSYIPKTRPLWLGSSGSGGKKLGPITRTKTIRAHSIEPRLWSKTLAAQRIGPFAASVQTAVNEGMK